MNKGSCTPQVTRKNAKAQELEQPRLIVVPQMDVDVSHHSYFQANN
jgi:hypothetical protein